MATIGIQLNCAPTLSAYDHISTTPGLVMHYVVLTTPCSVLVFAMRTAAMSRDGIESLWDISNQDPIVHFCSDHHGLHLCERSVVKRGLNHSGPKLF